MCLSGGREGSHLLHAGTGAADKSPERSESLSSLWSRVGMQSPRGRRLRPSGHSFRGSANRSAFTFTSSTRGRNSFPPSHNRNQQREVHFENATQSFRSRITASRGRPPNRQRGMRSGISGRQQVDPETQWFRVEVPHGESSGKEFLLRAINAELEKPLVPYNYQTDGTSVIFYVVGNDVADSLRSLSRRITKPDGFKIAINAKPCTAPQSQIDDSLLQQLRDVMSKRFALDLNYLDLSGFRKDEFFVSKELYVPLDRPAILKEVVKIIELNIPNLTILNLAENRIKFLESLSPLKSHCPALKAVNLSKNMISSQTELDHLKGLDLEELWLQGNPCSNVKDKTSYISAIRALFPKITKLDGEALPAAIGFDVGDEKTTIPASMPSCIPDLTQSLVHGFLKAYYDLFDSESRQQLVAAYHDQASYSLSITRSPEAGQKGQFSSDLIQESRNLMRVREGPARTKLLKQGKINVVAALTGFPQTQHIRESFLIDVPFFSEHIIVIVVNGVYWESCKNQAKSLRSFCRNLTIIPQGEGYVIANDMLMLTNASYEQRGKYRAPDHMSEKKVHVSAMTSEVLITRMRQQTGMNEKFSHQCLSECDYDFDKALQMFNALNSKGGVPPEAFV